MFDAQILKLLHTTQAGKSLSTEALTTFVNDIFARWDAFLTEVPNADEDDMDDFIDEVLWDIYGDDLDASADGAELLDVLEPYLWEKLM